VCLIRSAYGSEGWGFESLRARLSERPETSSSDAVSGCDHLTLSSDLSAVCKQRVPNMCKQRGPERVGQMAGYLLADAARVVPALCEASLESSKRPACPRPVRSGATWDRARRSHEPEAPPMVQSGTLGKVA